MEWQLDPTVLDLARERVGARSDEELGQQFLGKTGATVRRYRKGQSLPDVETLMKLRKLTNRPMDTMIVSHELIGVAK